MKKPPDEHAGTVYIYDRREHGFFIVDNPLVMQYGEHIGPYAIAAYNVLACYAGKKMVAYPSYRTIAKRMGASRSTAMRAIKTLIEWRIIEASAETRDTEDGNEEHESNRYFLRRVADWKPLPSVSLTETRGSCETPPLESEGHHGSGPQKPKQKALKKTKITTTPAPAVVADESLVSALTTVGIGSRTAQKLAATRPEECRRQLEWLPHRNNVKDPAAMLVRAIENGWAAPGNNGASAPEPAPPKRQLSPEQRAAYAAHRERIARAVWDGLDNFQRRLLARTPDDGAAFVDEMWLVFHSTCGAMEREQPTG